MTQYFQLVFMITIFIQLILAEDPCDPSVHTVVSGQSQRSTAVPLSDSVTCDRRTNPGWYRFCSSAGNDMPTSCVPAFQCSTYWPIWLNGTLPNTEDGLVEIKACATVWSDCCYDAYQMTVKVKSCGDFRVYYLSQTASCEMAYCFGTEVPDANVWDGCTVTTSTATSVSTTTAEPTTPSTSTASVSTTTAEPTTPSTSTTSVSTTTTEPTTPSTSTTSVSTTTAEPTTPSTGTTSVSTTAAEPTTPSTSTASVSTTTAKPTTPSTSTLSVSTTTAKQTTPSTSTTSGSTTTAKQTTPSTSGTSVSTTTAEQTTPSTSTTSGSTPTNPTTSTSTTNPVTGSTSPPTNIRTETTNKKMNNTGTPRTPTTTAFTTVKSTTTPPTSSSSSMLTTATVTGDNNIDEHTTNDNNINDNGVQSHQTNNSTGWILAFSIVAGILVLIGVVVTAVCILRRKQLHGSRYVCPESNLRRIDNAVYGNKKVSNSYQESVDVNNGYAHLQHAYGSNDAGYGSNDARQMQEHNYEELPPSYDQLLTQPTENVYEKIPGDSDM